MTFSLGSKKRMRIVFRSGRFLDCDAPSESFATCIAVAKAAGYFGGPNMCVPWDAIETVFLYDEGTLPLTAETPTGGKA
jgi:hypothetical protein